MLSLHTNNAALSAQNAIGKTQANLSTAMTRLSTGYRINTASDDAAGLQIATRLKAQTSGMSVAMKNTQNATSMLQTASGAFNEVNNMLVRMKDLATQAADASSSSEDQVAMQSEFDALGHELNNIIANTTYGGRSLLKNGSSATDGALNSKLTFQIGSAKSETMELNATAGMKAMTQALSAAAASFKSATATGSELLSGTAANSAIDLLTTAINSVGTVNSALGATINRLDHINSNLSNIATNTEQATGRITDTDFATESANMTQNQMLLQAGTAMLKQSNSMSSLVMSLLQ